MKPSRQEGDPLSNRKIGISREGPATERAVLETSLNRNRLIPSRMESSKYTYMYHRRQVNDASPRVSYHDRSVKEACLRFQWHFGGDSESVFSMLVAHWRQVDAARCTCLPRLTSQ